MIINTKVLDQAAPYVSVSRLKTFSSCSYYYYNKYIENIPVSSTSESTVIGSIVHDALEYFYSVHDDSVFHLIDAFMKTAPKTLVKLGLLMSDDADHIFELLLDCCEDITKLNIRASANYIGKDAIRKKDGSVAQNAAQTSDWKKAEKELDLVNRREVLDNYCILPKEERPLSITLIVSEAYLICKNYRTPKEIQEIIAIEFPLSKWDESTKTLINPVLLPTIYQPNSTPDNEIYLNGYIDMIAKVNYKGRSCLAIIDHKSSKTEFEVMNVMYNRQLMIYAYLYEQLTGEIVEVIGINNLRENTLALAEIDRDIMKESMYSLLSHSTLIEQGHFVKHMPEDSYSPCVKMYGELCPYLENCHPTFYQSTIN